MRTFAQIQDEKLHWKFEQEDAPDFAENLVIVEITDLAPMPEEGWSYEGGDFMPPPPPTAEEIMARIQAKIAVERQQADDAIAPLQDAVDIDDATDTEILLLKNWKKFRVALNRLADQPGYPTSIEWPPVPT
ncbi:tail fiber assembly protein [Pseudomonas mandelii]